MHDPSLKRKRVPICHVCEKPVESLDRWGECEECAEDRDVALNMEHEEGEVRNGSNN